MDPFLTGMPAKVNITATTWTQIIRTEQSLPAEVSTATDPPPEVEDVRVTSTKFWGLAFTSGDAQKNTKYLGSSTGSIDGMKNTAYVGDGHGSAVVLLDDNATLPAEGITLDDVCTQFGIGTGNPGDTRPLQTFLKKVKGLVPIAATLLPKGTTSPVTNAIWFVTEEDSYECTCTLTFNIGAGKDSTGPLPDAISWLNEQLGLSLTPPNFGDLTKIQIPISFSQSSRYQVGYTAPGKPLSSTYMLAYQFDIKSFTLSIEFSSVDVSVLLRPLSSTKDASIPALLADITGSGPQDDLPGGSDNLFTQFFSHFYLWNVRLRKSFSSTKLDWGVSLLAAWSLGSDTGPDAQPIVIALTYDSSISTYMGKLLLAQDLPSPIDRRLPMYDRRLEIPQAVYTDLKISSLPSSLDLWKLTGQEGKPPPIPTEITDAEITYQSTGNSRTTKTSVVTFRTEIVADTAGQFPVIGDNSDPDAAPLGGLSWDTVRLDIQRATTKDFRTPGSPASNVSTAITLSSNFTLASTDPDSRFGPATLDLTLSYSSSRSSTGCLSAWKLNGHVRNLSVGLIAGFFHEDCKSGAMAVLGNLTLSSLDILCLYGAQTTTATKSNAASFLITAVLKLGDLELDLSYQYVSSKAAASGTTAAAQKWGSSPPRNVTVRPVPSSGYAYTFEAYLKVAANSTIGSIAESIVPGSGTNIPDFVGDIVISVDDPTNTPVKLRYRGDKNGSALVVFVRVNVFNLTFVQLRTKEAPSKLPTVKKFLRISVDQIPMMKDIPLVNELPQPFDHLIYLWVSDNSTATDKGFTRDLIEAGSVSSSAVTVNGELADMTIPLLQRVEKARPQPTDLELKVGHHFMIVTGGKVVLDHVFGSADKNPNPKPGSTTSSGRTTNTLVASSTTADDPPPTKGRTTTQAGPLTLNALSLQFTNGQLRIGIDATLNLGPMSFSVIGFVVSVKMNDPDHPVRLNNLASIITDKLISATIHGLSVSLEKGPLTIAGGFEHNTIITEGKTEDYYRGGVCVGLKAWKLLAIGQYSIVTVARPPGTYRSVFVYGKLDGPLIELEFATISGVRLGFGYNSGVHNPNINQLYLFPFISDAGLGTAADDPMAVLKALLEPSTAVPVPFVYTKEGMGWFCMGMTITAFDCITLTTVAIFEIDTDPNHNGVIVTLFADGIIQMQPLVTDPNLTLFYIEIIVSVEMNFIEGYIAANAALAPQSHVYVPQAHLSGGASFYSWFGNNPNSGDWVITIGGFHRAYQRPTWYPNPGRLRLSFVIGDNINVTGEAYMAITPKCAMAGGLLHMSLNVGPVEAWCDVVLDVFINFKPFYFIAHISLSVGCSFNVDIWFIHVHISVSIGADLVIWGPDKFGGVAHVDLWFFGFSIEFGERLVSTSSVGLLDFYEMVRKAGPESTPRSTDTTADNGPGIALLKISLEAGMYPIAPEAKDNKYPSTGALTEWQVEGGNMVFRVDVDIALQNATITQTNKLDPKDTTNKTYITTQSTVGPDTPPTINSYPMHRPLDSSTLNVRVHSLDDSGNPTNVVPGFSGELVTKEAPSALWREYNLLEDPLVNSSPATLQSPAAATYPLNMGLRIKPPPPVLALSPIVEFDAVACMRATIVRPDTVAGVTPIPYNIPPITSEASTVLPKTYEADKEAKTRWSDFGKILKTSTSTVQPMLDLCADVLGWKARPTSEKVGGVVPVVSGVKSEWELNASVPSLFADQVSTWYESLPMVVAAAT